jgi:Ca2+-binding RTX toxin-like protein
MYLDNLRFGIVGSAKADNMNGTSGPDHYNGLAGNDIIEGLGGDDTLIGGSGRDTLRGGDGEDLLSGGAGKDKLFGDGGSDTLNGGPGADRLTGGTENDTFTLHQNEIGGDVITDFSGAGVAGGDHLRFEGFGADATLSHIGDDWTVSYSGGNESFEIIDVTALIASDYLFV